MDPQEKKVLRWKRDLVAANLSLDDVTIQRLRSHDLIWDAIITELNETEVRNCEKIWKYLEHLIRAKLDRNVFQAFCEFLDEENPWISSELRVELTLEKGQLKIDEYIKNEAALLVHRYFGTSKRLSETEKKQFEELLAMRTQCTKNIWIKNVEQTKESLIAQISFENQRKRIQKEIISRIIGHLKYKGHKINGNFQQNSFSDDTLTEEEAYRWMNSQNNLFVVKTLEEWVDKLLDVSSKTHEKCELMKEEKERFEALIEETLDALGFKVERNGPTRLDKQLKNLVKSFDEKLTDLGNQVEESKKECRQLEKKLQEQTARNEDNTKERDKQIRFLIDNLEKSQGDASQKSMHLDIMDENLGEANEKIMNLEEKVKYWERYRHFGYWYARNQGILPYSFDEPNPPKSTSTKSKPISRKSTTKAKNK